MDPRITDIASYLASRIPTGADSDEDAVQDWRLTLYNAKATASVRPLTDMIVRSVPDDPIAAAYCEALRRR
jgi:hypothetical protein